MASKDELGRRGEIVAAKWLEKCGFVVLDRNWRCSVGEIDLVLRTGSTTVFAEVKTRSSTVFGHPFETITAAKTVRLRRLVAEWVRAYGPAPGPIRIDAVAVLDAWSATPKVEHLTGIA